MSIAFFLKGLVIIIDQLGLMHQLPSSSYIISVCVSAQKTSYGLLMSSNSYNQLLSRQKYELEIENLHRGFIATYFSSSSIPVVAC